MNSEPNLDVLWTEFSSSVAMLQVFQSGVNQTIRKELGEIANLNKLAEQYPDNAELGQSGNNLVMKHFATGKVFVYNQHRANLDDRERMVFEYKNKQYLWLFVEIYELFEDFVAAIYAYIGCLDKNSWPLEDFGKARLSEIPLNDYGWHLDRSKAKRNAPR
jgi:hypothetical protein